MPKIITIIYLLSNIGHGNAPIKVYKRIFMCNLKLCHYYLSLKWLHFSSQLQTAKLNNVKIFKSIVHVLVTSMHNDTQALSMLSQFVVLHFYIPMSISFLNYIKFIDLDTV